MGELENGTYVRVKRWNLFPGTILCIVLDCFGRSFHDGDTVYEYYVQEISLKDFESKGDLQWIVESKIVQVYDEMEVLMMKMGITEVTGGL